MAEENDGREVSSLPALVRRYVEAVLPGGSGTGTRVRIEQVGDMTLKPGSRPRRFTATEEFATDHVAFEWTARFPMLGPISLLVTDRYDAGEGLLEVRLLGLPLQRKRGPELALGEAFRYLAEIAWTPHAILDNSELEWRELDESTVEVATSVGGDRAAVRLVFDDTGEITKIFAERPRLEAKARLPRGSASTATTGNSTASASPLVAKCAGSFPTGPTPTGAEPSPRSHWWTERMTRSGWRRVRIRFGVGLNLVSRSAFCGSVHGCLDRRVDVGEHAVVHDVV